MSSTDQGPSGLPAMPVAPQYDPRHGALAEPVEPVERPSSLTTAVRLMYVGAVLSVIGVVATWATKDELRDQVVKAGTDLTASQVDTAVSVGLGVATASGVVGVALWLWMAAVNGRGLSWARVVGTVFGGLDVVFTLVSLSGGTATPIALTLSLVSLVLAAVILVLLWRPSSSAYYRAQSARRG